MLHQKRDTKNTPWRQVGGNDAFGARSETQRRRNIPRMARNRGISKAHSQITVKTGLAGWSGRIRTSAFQNWSSPRLSARAAGFEPLHMEIN